MNKTVINNCIKGIAQVMVVVVKIQYCMYMFSSDLKQQATDAGTLYTISVFITYILNYILAY